MKKLNILSLVFILIISTAGCSDDSGPSGPTPEPNKASSQKQFVYNAMNYWYYWQGEVPDLADGRFDSDEAFQNYLKDYTDAESLFNNLKYKDDRFSFFIDDYEKYLQERDGIFAALGFNYGFIGFKNNNDIVGYIRYVIPGTPADEANLQRLDLFTKVDGTSLNTSNYTDLLTSNASHKLTLAHIQQQNGGVSFTEDSTVTVASKEVKEDPVYKDTVMTKSGINIGYLVYNAFQGNSHQRLNEVFGDFKSEGVNQLVLDLRYNGGGAVLTSRLLSSMISGLGSNNKFANFNYNAKRSQQSKSVSFLDKVPTEDDNGDFVDDQGNYIQTEPINSLSLNKLYVLVSNSTASASEALINSLRAYIDVTIIGTQTIGKDQGALLLFDAPPPYIDKEKANDAHKKAIQPIVLKFTNADGQTYPYEYTTNDGINVHAFKPSGDNNISEITVDNLNNKPALGDPAEPLLARAISLITGQPPKTNIQTQSATMLKISEIKAVQPLRPHGNTMYVEPFMTSSMTQ